MATSKSPGPTSGQGQISYQDFDPEFEWSQEEGSDTLRIHLPGFKRDNLRVEVDDDGHLMTRGEQPLDSTRRRRFGKEFRIPENCMVDDIYAKFENGVLYVIHPKVKTTGQGDHPKARELAVEKAAAGRETETMRHDDGGSMLGLTKPMQPLLNVAVAILLLLCLAMYAAYKLGKAT